MLHPLSSLWRSKSLPWKLCETRQARVQKHVYDGAASAHHGARQYKKCTEEQDQTRQKKSPDSAATTDERLLTWEV